MAELRIRKIDDWVLAVHQRLAHRENDSLGNRLRRLLTEAAIEPQFRSADRAEAQLHLLKEKYGVMADSADLLRDERWDCS